MVQKQTKQELIKSYNYAAHDLRQRRLRLFLLESNTVAKAVQKALAGTGNAAAAVAGPSFSHVPKR